VSRSLKAYAALLLLALFAAGCAASKAFRQGDEASRAGRLDDAVASYRQAVQAEPDNTTYRIALERAMRAASRAHLERAKQLEDQGQLEAAVGEYRLATEFDASNRVAGTKVANLERAIRERDEAARPKPAIQHLRDQARAAAAEPILNPASREPLNIRFNNASLRDVLNFIGNATGINITYDRDVVDRPTTIQLDGVTLEQALNQIMTIGQLSYKIQTERAIFVFPDTAAKHTQYDEQVVRTFYLSNADATEISQLLSAVIRLPQMAVQPIMAANKTANTLTVRASTSVMQIIEKIIDQNDKPRAEIIIDVEILEVDRNRAKNYGLNLSQYAIGGVFSPEVSPGATTTTTPGTGGGTGTSVTSGRSTPPDAVVSPPPFNLNTISRGINTADFYLAVPTAIMRFLETDTHTKIIAKPQLRGAEGMKISLNLGQAIPVVSTSYTPIATGGAGVNPLSSYQYRDVGVNIDMTPRVTLDGNILMDLLIDDSAVGAPQTVAGVTVPSFIQRKVTTRLRLRDGESNLLAGLVQQNETNTVSGFPGAVRVPLFKQLFSGNTTSNDQTEIVMLLTPHIVRTNEITVDDLKPLFIGSAGNLGLGGAPPLIGQPLGDGQPPAPVAPAPVPAPAPTTPNSPTPGVLRGPGGTALAPPPGSSPVPGTVLLPQPTPPAATTPEPAAAAPSTAVTTNPAPAPPSPSPQTTQAPLAPAVVPPPAPASPGATTSSVGSAVISIAAPTTPIRVGGGPYLIPISISNARVVSTITVTLTFDPTKLRVRTVQEGGFMRTGGVNVTFSQQASGGRIDITLSRAADATGASGTGLLAAVLFDAIAPGPMTLSLSGVVTGAGGTPMGAEFRQSSVTVVQ
jgi:general secretion pathway protein D